MNSPKAFLAVVVGIMACPVAPWGGETEDLRAPAERREAMWALIRLVELAEQPQLMVEEMAGLPTDHSEVFQLVLFADAVFQATDDPARRRRTVGGILGDKPPPAVPDLQDKDLNRADREILAELEGPKPRPPAPSGDDFVIRLFEMYTSLGQGWSEGAPGSRTPIRSTPDPARPAAPPQPTPADFERITRESAGVYQESVAAMQQNAEDWQRRQESIDRMHEAIQQTGDILRQQQDDWHNRHPDLPAPPSTQPQAPPSTRSKPPPGTTSKPPSHPGKPSAGSSGGQRSGDRQGGTVKRTDKTPPGGVKRPPPAPQSHRCQKCGKISPRVYFCQKCHLWHCPGQ